jgi:hypothetical protein
MGSDPSILTYRVPVAPRPFFLRAEDEWLGLAWKDAGKSFIVSVAWMLMISSKLLPPSPFSLLLMAPLED